MVHHSWIVNDATEMRVSFYGASSALKSEGVICSQGETYWSMLELIVKMQNDLKELFPSGNEAVFNFKFIMNLSFIWSGRDSNISKWTYRIFHLLKRL